MVEGEEHVIQEEESVWSEMDDEVIEPDEDNKEEGGFEEAREASTQEEID